MSAYDLNAFEAKLIDTLRSGTPYEMGAAVADATDAALEARGLRTEPAPAAPKPAAPVGTYAPPRYSKLLLWLIRHGIGWEYSPYIQSIDGFQRHMAIVINHRFFGLGIMIDPFKGVFADELNKSHAEIAAQYEAGRR